MPGLSLMALGPFQFQAMGFGFNGRSRSQKTGWAATPVAGGFDVLQWTGGEGRTETISGAIFSEFGGQFALDGLKLAARIGRPLPLVDLSGSLLNVYGMQAVEEITEESDTFDRSGGPLKVSYSIKLRGYQGDLKTNLQPILSLFS